jgi:carboxymethylenebutenolidase
MNQDLTMSSISDDTSPLTQIEIDQRLFDLYDEYCHGRMDRREFLTKSAAVTAGGLAMAQALLPMNAHRPRNLYQGCGLPGTLTRNV